MAIYNAKVLLERVRSLYDRGFGSLTGATSFQEYCKAIPPLPLWDSAKCKRFDKVVLVDRRVPLLKVCTELYIMAYGVAEELVFDFAPSTVPQQPVYWIRCQEGTINLGKTMESVRRMCLYDEIGLTAIEGISLLVQYPDILVNHGIDLPGSMLLHEYNKELIYNVHWSWFRRLFPEPAAKIDYAFQQIGKTPESFPLRNSDYDSLSLHLFMDQPSLFFHPDAPVPNYGSATRFIQTN